MAGKIFYLIHDFPVHGLVHRLRRWWVDGRERPITGGVQYIYQHSDILNRNGYAAYVVHLGNFTVDWFKHETMAITKQEAREIMAEDDIVLIPERIPELAAEFNCREKIALVQGHGLLGDGEDKFDDWGFTGLLANSDFVKEYLHQFSDLPCRVITCGIDHQLFKPAPELREANRLLYFRRKHWEMGKQALSLIPEELKQQIKVVEVAGPQLHREMASHYQLADIFLNLGFPEGFGLTGLEAMACGCVVVGFTGGGGSAYMLDRETAMVVPDGDVNTLAQALITILKDETLKEEIRRRGMKKSQEFSEERMTRELLEVAENCWYAARET